MSLRRVLTGMPPGEVDELWGCDPLMQVLLWLLATLVCGVMVAGWVADATVGNAIPAAVALIGSSLLLWIAGYRMRVAVVAGRLIVVNLPRTYEIPLDGIRQVEATDAGLRIRYWDGQDFDEVVAFAVQKPRLTFPVDRETRADLVARSILARLPRW